ncbi:1-acyl-sn-glycerol-3-phosphate acyltransferase [Cyanobium sp. CH-040]|nr:1-acyl-sn-glycerol-3-phosphate acyltransferase [Cyanobium sp. CH-040]
MGPIGVFFARFCRYLRGCGIPVTKVMFPLHEFGFPREVQVPFRGSMEAWRPFLRQLLSERRIRHIFMYGDFIIPHRIAIEEAQRAGVEAWVFELGYIRPNYVTLERDRVNARSNLNRPVEDYRSLPPVDALPQGKLDPGWRWRKLWKAPTFIQHAFTRYPIIEGEHKLQPSPRFLWCQLRGSWRYWLYRWQERSLKRRLLEHLSYFLVVLQVSSDSQVQLGSPYRGMHDFIEDVISSFASHAHASDHLAFKHHPRDRGYNHYGRLIQLLAQRHGVAGRVHYFHDGALSRFLRTCRGVVTVNSTVGLQALYHAVPTKVMGHTFYNLPGLTDQQPLDQFWRDPHTSDRPLFYRFYDHLVTTTQVNGNFDADFPFRTTFPIGPEARRLPPRPSLPSPGQTARVSPLALVARVVARLGWTAVIFLTYGLQLLALLLGQRRLAAQLLALASQTALRALGVQVVVDDSHPSEPAGVPLVHICNHDCPFDVLVIQGVLRMPSLTTASLHLPRVLPWFSLSATNAGYVLLDHRNGSSRRTAALRASALLEERGELMIVPSGSLVTPITERVSASPWVLARRHGARIVPWVFSYQNLDDAKGPQYSPLGLLSRRLAAPMGTIHCRRGRASDLNLPADPTDRQVFQDAVRSYYAGRTCLRQPAQG